MSDIKVKLTEQSIGVPDTGSFVMLNSDNATGGINYGLLVSSFAVIAIIFTLAIVAVIKRAKHKKHSGRYNQFAIHSKTKTALSFSICIILASILIPIASQYFSNNQKTAQAATDTLTISAEPISITAELNSDDTVTAVSSNVTVTSATTAGYTLGVYAASKDLVSPDDSIATKISGLSMDNTEPTALSPNTWGLATTAPTDSSSKVWRAISDSETAATVIKTTSTATPANDVTTVWYGINVNDKLEPSEYTGTINYIAVANVVSDASQLQCNPSGATISEIVCMQDINAANRLSIFDSMAQDEQYQLYDSRDNKQYYVAKLADGNVWMTQNLDHNIGDIEGGTYTPADTDIKENWTPTVAEYTHGMDDVAWVGSRTAAESYDPGDICWDGSIVTELDETIEDHTTTCNNDRHYRIGNYYNWTASVAGNDLVSIDGGINGEYDMDTSICPSGWTLPKSGRDRDVLGSFAYLNKRLDFTAGLDGNIHQAPVYLTYSGYWDGEIHLFAESGEYWLGTSNGSGRAWFIDFNALNGGRIGPNDSDFTFYGRMLRCLVLNPEPEPTPDPTPEPEPEPNPPYPGINPDVTFNNVEWTKYGDIKYQACSDAEEPAAGEHITFPSPTSIRLLGSTGSAVNLGAYYDKFDPEEPVSIEFDINATSINAHPADGSGGLTVSLDAINPVGDPIFTGIKLTVNNKATISLFGTAEELSVTDEDFTVLFLHKGNTFKACVASLSDMEPRCISADNPIMPESFLKLDFNLQHVAHCCSVKAETKVDNILIFTGDNITEV